MPAALTLGLLMSFAPPPNHSGLPACLGPGQGEAGTKGSHSPWESWSLGESASSRGSQP